MLVLSGPDSWNPGIQGMENYTPATSPNRKHGSMFPACRGQPVFLTSRSRPHSPTRHVTSPLSARSTRLRSPILPQVALHTWCRRGLGVFLRLKELPSRMLLFVSAAFSVQSRNASSASKLLAQLMMSASHMQGSPAMKVLVAF